VTLPDVELYDVADRFGVDLDQVRRDHVISHVLAAISRRARDAFLFVGGTMLSRTWLPDLRLSEDVDLMVFVPRAEAGGLLADAVDAAVVPIVGSVSWDVDPRTAKDSQAIYLSAGDDVTIKFQLVDTTGRPRWPHLVRDIEQRYVDAPPARLNVPTAQAAVAMKLTAWVDRRTSRDLYDLWAMTQQGMVDAGALALYHRFGQTTKPLGAHVFQNPPSQDVWEAALGHQCILAATPIEAVTAVGKALDALGAVEGGYENQNAVDPSDAWRSVAQHPRLGADG